MVLNIFYNEIIKGASIGNIQIGDFTPAISFYTNIIEDNNFNANDKINPNPVLVINNKDRFNEKLINYANLAIEFYYNGVFNHDNIKSVLAYIFVNASEHDLINPISYLEKRINFLKWNKKEVDFNEILDYKTNLNIKKQSAMLEAPYSFSLSLTDGNELYNFPEIIFGVSKDEAYIYAIQNKNKKEENNNLLKKKINRLLFKLNANFSEEKISDDFNASDVSMSFVASLILFIRYLSEIGITKINTQVNMPIRYNSHFESTRRKLEYYKKRLSEDEFTKYQEKIDIANKLYNDNVFMKLIRTIYRVSCMGDVIKISDYPLNYDSSLKVIINKEGIFNNDLATKLYYSSKKKDLH